MPGMDYPLTSLLAGLTPGGERALWSAWQYFPLENSKEILQGLLEKYWKGQTKPLHFFPESSWEYALHMNSESGTEDGRALERARQKWSGSEYVRGEREDAYYQLCFRDSDLLDPMDPLGADFQAMAEDVYGPLLRHRSELEE